jgi:hypothetical protein
LKIKKQAGMKAAAMLNGDYSRSVKAAAEKLQPTTFMQIFFPKIKLTSLAD